MSRGGSLSGVYSPGSGASTSASSEQVCELCGSASRTLSASESSLSTGLESPAIPTCAPLWPTPDASVANDGEGPETWLARRETLKEKGYNGNGAGMPLAIAVQAPMERLGRCPCRCHTSMSSAAGSPARTSALLERVPGSTGRARVFGQSMPVSLANFDPATSSWRTFQLCLDGDLDEFSEIWPRSGMTRSGIAYRLQPLAPLTGGIASGLLPTRTVTMADRGGRGDLLQVARGNPSPSGHFKWPTPTKADAEGGPGNSGREGGENLRTAVGGSLNPTWVEWLMGFPCGWTDLGASVTPSSRRSPSGSENES